MEAPAWTDKDPDWFTHARSDWERVYQPDRIRHMVRETADLILGAEFRLIQGAGHLPFVEQPQAYASAVTGFLTRIAHV